MWLPRDLEAAPPTMCPPPTTRPTPTCGAPTCETRRCSSNDKEADPASYIAGGRWGRLVEQSWDRLGRCFLHAASYNVIITASIPRELPQHLESQLEWGERGGEAMQWVVAPELNVN